MLLIALAISFSLSTEHVDYCHRWATADIQAVAECEVLSFSVAVVETAIEHRLPLPLNTRDAFANAPIANRPRELVCTMSSGN